MLTRVKGDRAQALGGVVACGIREGVVPQAHAGDRPRRPGATTVAEVVRQGDGGATLGAGNLAQPIVAREARASTSFTYGLGAAIECSL